MIRKIWGINLVLAVAVVLLSMQAYLTWRNGNASTDAPPGSSIDIPSTQRLERKEMPYGAYETVASNNLFSPDRSENTEKLEKKEGKKEGDLEDPVAAILERNFTLHGVIFQKGKPRALINVPIKDKQEKSIRWVSIGDQLNEYTVSDILPDRVSIKTGANTYAIELYTKKGDSGPKTKRAETGPKQPVKAETGSKPAVRDTKSVQKAPTVVNTQSSSEKDTPKKEAGEGKTVIDGNYQIIETPFGKSRIRIK